jgi:hypothetical protein
LIRNTLPISKNKTLKIGKKQKHDFGFGFGVKIYPLGMRAHEQPLFFSKKPAPLNLKKQFEHEHYYVQLNISTKKRFQKTNT